MPKKDAERRRSQCENAPNSAHSFNYRLGEVLRKEIQCLNREEKNTACSMTINQRIITTRFRNKLSRSVEHMKYHDKLKSRFHTHELRTSEKEGKGTELPGSLRQTSAYSADENVSKEKYDFDSKFSPQKFTVSSTSRNRPQTAVETKSKLWHKRADTAKERVVRAKSAPPSSWRNCNDIMRKLNCGGGGFYAANKVARPLSRAKFYDVFDSERFAKFREMELEKQANDVHTFIQSTEALKLVPWFPGPVGKTDDKKVTKETKKERKKYPGFVTKVDSF